jgi:membrane protein insertase Oxa1/YidC/SpoIIIJ
MLQQQISKIIISLIIIGVVVFLAFFIDKKHKKERVEGKQVKKNYLTKTGSIIFYVFMLFLLILFLVLYIKWRNL